VATHDSAAAAARVAATTARLRECGLVLDRDPRLGQVSEQLIGELPDGAAGTEPSWPSCLPASGSASS
jgi:hypothetical protein